MKYKNKENGKIEKIEDIKKEHQEIIHNSVYSDDEIADIKNFEDFLKLFYDEV